MIFSVGYLLLAVVRWIGKTRRRNMFRKILAQAVEKSSICVQKRCVQSQSLARKFIKNEGQYQETPLSVYNKILITAINPKQTLDLSDWTAYIKCQGKDSRKGQNDDVTLILEAVRPDNIQNFLEHQLDLSQSEKISVLNHGCATAWISGSPFGIVYHCSFEELITLTMGMEDGCLTLNEALEVKSLTTINTVGTPQSLLNQPHETDSQSNVVQGQNRKKINIGDKQKDQLQTDMDHLAEDFAHTVSGVHDEALETWSNESLASDSSVGKVELLDPSEIDMMDDSKGQTDFVEENGSGEGLSEMSGEDLEDSHRISHTTTKPPNVLIYTGKTDTVRKFEKVKKVLEECLDPDCYVIYHLKHEELNSNPWIENTSLLVVSGAKINEKESDVFLQYFYAGGKVLSLATDFDSKFVNKIQIRSEKWMSEIEFGTWNDISLVCSRYAYNMKGIISQDFSVTELARDKDRNTVMVQVDDRSKISDGCVILSQVLLESDASDLGVTPEIFNQLKKSNVARFEILTHILNALGLECNTQNPKPLTPAGLVTKSKKLWETFLTSIERRLTSRILKSGSISLLFTTGKGEQAEETLLPILIENTDTVCRNFNTDTYMNNLETDILGNTVIYVDVVPTTMPLLDGMMFSIPQNIGLIAVARQQTSGKGRGGNSWLSPVGCAMCTLHVRIPLDSKLGKCVSYLQHITSLAVVYSVCQLQGYQDIDLRLKWPNDIYYGRVMKLGGVIVKSTVLDGMVHATIGMIAHPLLLLFTTQSRVLMNLTLKAFENIVEKGEIAGCGFNVDNSNPTMCINDIIQSYNRQHGTQLSPCTTEQLLARTVTWIEKLIGGFQADGPETFQQMYYEKWLHSDATVTLQSEGNIEVKIIGLNEYGYLMVKTSDGQMMSVQPDGNSFDMMKNLITLKTR